jgi:LysM repeat protein
MISLRLIAPSALALAFVSCAADKADKYDTVAPGPDAQLHSPYGDTAANPVYDTPAAYEESGVTPANPAIAPYNPEPSPNTAGVPAAPSNGAAIIHTVVAGDTLSGISAKYKVPAAAIKQANNMTKDTVILGRKMVIPPVY